MEALVASISQLLQTLDKEYRAGKLEEDRTSAALNDLHSLLRTIDSFVEKEVSVHFLKLLFTKNQRIARIEAFHQRISTSVASFQIAALLDIREWQMRNDGAKKIDQQALDARLLQLENNHQQLMETLHTYQHDVMEMMVSLKRRLDHHSDGAQEQHFFSHTLQYLTTVSGHQVEIKHWMITSYEVEFGLPIGSGGFGEVFKGTWNKTQVALKVLKTKAGVTPSSTSLRHEIAIWSLLRHPSILQFLGANEFDDKPFIVMPYLKNGNAREYIQRHPECDRLQILYHISLGLIHLHFHNVVHGDLKALNVLIDDAENAVICDFGLAHIKADVISRAVGVVGQGESLVGSRNWMAPERLLGESPKKPSDIYSFGMTIYEIFTDRTPLRHIDFDDFRDLVGYGNVRPERPKNEDAPHLSDAMWELMEECWAKDPKHRPIANTVCDTISIQRDIVAPYTRPIPNPPPPPPPHDLTVRPNNHRTPSSPSTLTIQGGLNSSINCATFSFDGEYIASGAAGGHTQVWNARQGNPEKSPTTKGTYTTINCVAFSPHGPRIAVGYSDGAFRMFNSVTGKVISSFARDSTSVWSVCFAPDSFDCALGDDKGWIEIWNSKSGTARRTIRGDTERITSLAFNRAGARLASGSLNWTIKIWDLSTGRLAVEPLRGLQDFITFVAFSFDGTTIVGLSRNGGVCIWRTDNGSRATVPITGQKISPVVFTPNSSSSAISPNGKWIASVESGDPTVVLIIDSTTGAVVSNFEGHTGSVRTLSFSPDSKRVLSASEDKTIKVHILNA